ncbi:MAG: hypothetical protein C4522_09010 [Desulfobacteraceae bacterium]|nr:MAG: hypothetical protein C4522_09010 [Desulfobacteraceae bacterium]
MFDLLFYLDPFVERNECVMTSNNELKLAYCLTVILLLVGGICYAAFPVETPEDPVRKMFKTSAGNVLFTHKVHRAETGYGAACIDCHHHHEDDEDNFKACGDCHTAEPPKTVPQNCQECHDSVGNIEEHHPKTVEGEDFRACADCHQKTEDGSTPEACNECHEPDEIEGQQKTMNFQKRSDAFHTQCIDCHKEYGSGPVECSSCHVM